MTYAGVYRLLLLQLRPVHPFPFTEPLSQPLSLFSPFTSSPILNHISVSYLVGCTLGDVLFVLAAATVNGLMRYIRYVLVN